LEKYDIAKRFLLQILDQLDPVSKPS
jgi:hypothetical protein